MTAKSGIKELNQENDELKELAIKLGRIVLSTFLGMRSLSDVGNYRPDALGFESLSPEQVVSCLRDAALQCERLVRISAEIRTEGKLEQIGLELADKAAKLEAMFRIHPNGR